MLPFLAAGRLAAAVFTSTGAPVHFAAGLLLAEEAGASVSDADGVTYIVEGPLETPSGRKPRIRTVWLVETGQLAPRFITAYPLPA